MGLICAMMPLFGVRRARADLAAAPLATVRSS
jgi:hypothetical protein